MFLDISMPNISFPRLGISAVKGYLTSIMNPHSQVLEIKKEVMWFTECKNILNFYKILCFYTIPIPAKSFKYAGVSP